MNLQRLYTHQLLKTIMGVVFILCILISSCAVKSSIKNLLSINHHSQSSTSHKSFSNNSALKCNFCKEKEFIIKDNVKKIISDSPALILFTVLFITGGIFFSKVHYNTNYNSTKIGVSIPIFIRYRKLII